MSYFVDLIDTLSKIDLQQLGSINQKLVECSSKGGIVYVAGNGGSATISDHFVCDYNKSSHRASPEQSFRAISLNHSVSLTSALNNDFDTQEVFAWQVKHFCTDKDLFFAISSSGNSINIVKAVQAANEMAIPTISLTGMTGGGIKELSAYNFNIQSNNYGIIEDCHMSILHQICQNRN